MKKNKGGRPTKLNEVWLDAAEDIILSEDVVLLTDEELVDEINEKLDDQYKIHKNSFSNWKKKVKDKEKLDLLEERFLCLIKKAIRVQKKSIYSKFKSDDKWQRWAWVLERKFTEWNLKKISESTVKVKEGHGKFVGLTLKEVLLDIDEEERNRIMEKEE